MIARGWPRGWADHFVGGIVSRARPKRLCRQCGVNETRSTVGLCTQCRPAPAVALEDGVVFIAGIDGLSPAAALVLAHKLADVLAP